MTALRSKMATGAAWMILLRVVERGIGFVSTIILARLLVPEDFGVVAMAMSVYAALEIMTTFSFDLALIQNRNATRVHYDTAWTFNVLFGLGLAIALIAMAWPTAAFYGDERVAPVMVALASTALIRGFDNIGIVQFQRDLMLSQEFKLGLGRKLAGFVVTTICAFAWQSYWALIAGMVAQRVVSVAMTYAFHPFRPRFSLAAKDELLSYSKWLALNNIVLFVMHRANDFIVGHQAGPTALGAYNISYEVANLPTSELVFPISRALFPGYSAIADDRPQLKSLYMQVLSLIAWFSIPISAGMALLAEPLVLVLLGEKWRMTIPLIQVLVVFGVLRSLTSSSGNVYLAVGKTSTITTMSLLFLALMVPMSLVATARWGALGAAYAVAIAACIQFMVLARDIAGILNISGLEFFAGLWRPLAGSTLMALLVWQFDGLLQSHGYHAIARLVLGIGVGATTYLAVVALGWRVAGRPSGTESYLVGLAGKAWATAVQRRVAAP